MVVDEHFVVSILSGLPLDVAAPFLGAGITVYGPLSIRQRNTISKGTLLKFFFNRVTHMHFDFIHV